MVTRTRQIRLLLIIGCAVGIMGCGIVKQETKVMSEPESVDPVNSGGAGDPSEGAEKKQADQVGNAEYATFGAGCFWCVEAVFQELDGVSLVESGYEGGDVPDPTYEQICSGTTNHAEVCRLTYDPAVISFKELLEVFWQTHDPTTMNRQGNDVGTQYRSAVFYHSDKQKELAEKYKKLLNDSKAFDGPIVTEIAATSKFYKAEGYHQNYYRSNPNQGYCAMIIRPKLEKLRKVFGEKLRKAE